MVTSAVREKFAAMRHDLSSALIERDAEIDLVLTSILCRENCTLVGPPGTAKTMLADAIVEWLDGNKFSIMLTKFTDPAELFGQFSIPKLKEERFERVTTGCLPEAVVAVLDEWIRGSSAVLNTMLKILNERTFKNGQTVVNCPLQCAIATSNDWPNGETAQELNAMFDRFLFRKAVKPVSSASGRRRLLWSDDLTPKVTTRITPAEIATAQAEVKAVTWSPEAAEIMDNIFHACRAEGIIPGDRRTRKSRYAVSAAAYLAGSDTVKPDHLDVLAHILWDDPQEQPKKVAEIVGKLANPVGMKINSLMMAVDQIVEGFNAKDLASCSTVCSKLQSIHKELGDIGGNGRAKKAQDEVAAEIKKVRLATMNTI